MNWLRNKKTVATHSGNFHPDEVFSAALLSILYKGRVKIIRSREPVVYGKADIVFDVGQEYNPEKGKFDHHQIGGAGMRGNGIPYSSFGLLWKKYGQEICLSMEVANKIESEFVQVIDADDNAVPLFKVNIPGITNQFMFTDIFYDLFPVWQDKNKNMDQAFLSAVKSAKQILLRRIEVVKSKLAAKNALAEIYQVTVDKRIIIVTDPFLSSGSLSDYPEPLLVIKQDKQYNSWHVTTVSSGTETFESRIILPNDWCGKNNEELARITGVNDATFCHRQGFVCGAKSKEGAVKLAQLALQEAGKIIK